jgi:hypothetical protein
MIPFTDNQIQEITGQILATPEQISNLESNKAELVKIKQDYKDLDDANIVYQNFYTGNISAYQQELKHLNGVLGTMPNPSIITASTVSTWYPLYFPTSWFFLPPKLQTTDFGTTTTVFSPTESARYTPISTTIGLLENGFTSGAASDTTVLTTATYAELNNTAGFSIGHSILLLSGSNFAYGTITGIIGNDVYITTILGNLLSIGIGATVTNFHPGFTLPERESNTGLVGGELAYCNALKANIDSTVLDWESTLNSELSALNSNGAGGTEGTQNSAAIADINSAISAINTWQALPPTGGTSRYGTPLDTYIVAAIAARTAFIPTRIPQITASIGSASQPGPEGAFTGTGTFLKYCNIINMRIHRVEGTLSKYVNVDLGIKAITEKIALKQTQLAQDTSVFDVKEFQVDGNGSDTVKLKNVAGLAPSQTVKIISNKKGAITTTIVSINDLDVQLAASITADYAVQDKARLVRQIQ